MEKLARGFIALLILLSGLALLPYVDLPAEALSWQLFAGVYDATLTVNYPTGQPGSYFTFDGANFPENSTANITVNGDFLGSVNTDANGSLTFIINSTNSAIGTYSVSAEVNANASAATSFELTTSAPIRPLEGDGPIFYLVPTLYMPIVHSDG